MVLFDRPLNTPNPTERNTLAHAKAYSRPPMPTFEPSWQVRKATEADMRWLDKYLAKGSLDEITTTSRFQPISVLLKDLTRKSVIADKACRDQPVAVLEISQGEQGATLWSALTDGVIASDKYWSMTDYANRFLDHVARAYPTISTHVDARNDRQIAWLERVGFTLAEDLPQYGRNDLPFKRYIRG